MSRPNKYKRDVEPYLNRIGQMALSMTEAQIAYTLGISLSTWKRYKKAYEPLRTILLKGRKQLVEELKSTLITAAKGYKYEESKVIFEDGKPVKTEIITRYSKPDVAAANLLLKNYDKENWSNDPQYLQIKKEELELKKQMVEQQNW